MSEQRYNVEDMDWSCKFGYCIGVFVGFCFGVAIGMLIFAVKLANEK